MRTRSAKHKRS